VTKLRTLSLTLSFLIAFFYSVSHAIYLNDFLVNSEVQKYNDDFPSVLVGANGNFDVIWIKYRNVQNQYTLGRAYLKRFDHNGNVILPSTPLTADSMLVLSPTPAAILPAGGIVVTWADYTTQMYNPPYIHSYGQVYDSTGQPLTGVFRIDYLTSDDVLAFVTDVDVDSSGNIVILWRNFSDGHIYWQYFTNDGVPINAPMKADTCMEVQCTSPQDPFIAMHSDGRFVIVWYDNVVEYNSYLPVARLYDSTGLPVWPGAKLLTCDATLSTYLLSGSQGNCLAGGWTDVAMDRTRNFMIFMNAAAGEIQSNSVYGRLFNSAGIALTPNLKVNNSNPKTYDIYPCVNIDPEGGYYVMWSECRYSTYEGIRDVFLQKFDSLGNPVGDNWRVNTPRGSGKYGWTTFDIASSGDRAFIVWKDYRNWQDYPSYADTLLTDIYAQLVDVNQIGFYLPGDANFDGGIGLADVLYLVNYIFKGAIPPDPERWIGDVNADCKLTLADAIYLVNHIFKTGWPLQQGCAY